MKTVFLEPITSDSQSVRSFAEELVVRGHDVMLYNDRPNSEAETVKRIGEAEVIVIVNLPLSAGILAQAANLKYIAVAFTGLDHVDLEYCKLRNIQVANTPGYSTNAVAELTIGMMISGLRNFNTLEKNLYQGLDRAGFLGAELHGKTVGIIGMGAIGTRVSKILNYLGCNVLAFNRNRHNHAGEHEVSYTTLPELLKQSDIVSIHLPLTAETEHLINAKNLALLKPTAFLINTARGKIVDNQALALALRNGVLAGACIDVFDMEPPLPADYPLLSAPNVLLLPHIGYATQEAIYTRTRAVYSHLLRWLIIEAK